MKRFRFCSTNCRNRQKRGTNPEGYNKICQNCGGQFHTYKSHTKFCSKNCNTTFSHNRPDNKERHHALIKRWLANHPNYKPPSKLKCDITLKKCRITGKLFTTRNGRKIHPNVDSSKLNLERSQFMRDESPCAPITICRECNRLFIPSHRGSVYCSFSCSRRKASRISKQKRRLRKKEQYVEYVDRIKVFERDGWKCKQCDVDTPKELIGKLLDNAPQLDHIIPLSKGGEHSYANTQCLCRRCNISKSDTLPNNILNFSQVGVR